LTGMDDIVLSLVDERTPGGIRTRIQQSNKISPPSATDCTRSVSVMIEFMSITG